MEYNWIQLLGMMSGADLKQQFQATAYLNKLIEGGSVGVEPSMLFDIIPFVSNFLAVDQFFALQFESLQLIGEMMKTVCEERLVEHKVLIQNIIRLMLYSEVADMQIKAMQTLGLMAGVSVQIRNRLLEEGVLDVLLQLIHPQSSVDVLKSSSKLLSQLCCGRPCPEMQYLQKIFPVVVNLVYCQHEDVLISACQILASISEESTENIQIVIESGVCSRIVQLLTHTHYVVQQEAIRIMGNLATGNDSQTQAIINMGLLGNLSNLLLHENSKIRREACWTVSNILSGNIEQIQSVLNAGIFPLILFLFNDANDQEIKKESMWCISNALSGGSREQVQYLVDAGCIKVICQQLATSDNRQVSIALEAVENILRSGEIWTQQNGGSTNMYLQVLEEAGAIQNIENLQLHQNQSVYSRAVNLLEKYFAEEDDEQNEEQGGAWSANNIHTMQNSAIDEMQVTDGMQNMQISGNQVCSQDDQMNERMQNMQIGDERGSGNDCLQSNSGRAMQNSR
eukprot:TRINITY_DN5031_c0_g1_i2.p1 TRINITY_DN5031_c0_g1~~TRINITY_DN5031_c0_g1_i2.p1  ORF type:complete len:510 (-),score=56.28 TRINITY_DN5031_c0_g1_i2:240-1769(-)